MKKWILLLIGGLIMISLASETRAELPTNSSWIDTKNLIGYWRMDNSTNDDSIYGHNGTLIDNANCNTSVSGYLNTSCLFDGVSDRMAITHTNNLKPQLPVTISAWVYSNGTATSQYIFTNNGNTPNYFGTVLFLGADNKPRGLYGDGTGGGAASRRTIISGNAISLNTWTHLAVTMRGDIDMDIYINGVNQTRTFAGTGGALAYDAQNAFVANDGDSLFEFKGRIDELLFFNESLNLTEINTLYNCQKNTSNETACNHTAAGDTTAPTWDEYPQNWTSNNITNVLIDFNATDNIAIDTYFVNDTNFIINSTGHLRNATNLPARVYYLNVSVNDTSNNVNSSYGHFNWVNLTEYIPPSPIRAQNCRTDNDNICFGYDLLNGGLFGYNELE